MQPNKSFVEKIKRQSTAQNKYICVGLDSDYEKLPSLIKQNTSVTDAIFSFNKQIIDATHDIAAIYKPNVVFYAGYGIDGLKALQKTNEYIKSTYPHMQIIADCKRSEMKRSAELAAQEIFDHFLFDALIVTPWFGFDTIEPYTTYEGKAVFVLCHDSNPTAGEVQDAILSNGKPLYTHVTDLVCNTWNTTGNVCIEAPLTYPTILETIHSLAPKNQFFLIAGLGAQGGDIKNLHIFNQEKNFVVNASRSVIFASPNSDFAEKAREVVQNYNQQIDSLFALH